jgi:hypothetical protein
MAERKAYLLRIDPALWADLEAWAADELRSVNGQIEYLLKQATNKRKGTPLNRGVANIPNPKPEGEGGGVSPVK